MNTIYVLTDVDKYIWRTYTKLKLKLVIFKNQYIKLK